MMSWSNFSQNTTTKEVKISVLKNIKKELDKCDSLKIAYNLKSANLSELINTNLTMFKELEKERLTRLELQTKLQLANKNLIKTKKNNNKWLYFLGGVLIGGSGVILLTN